MNTNSDPNCTISEAHSKKDGGRNARTKNTVARLNMYRDEGKPTRNRRGKIIKAAAFQSRATPGEVARVDPNRKWFGKDTFNSLFTLLLEFTLMVVSVFLYLCTRKHPCHFPNCFANIPE